MPGYTHLRQAHEFVGQAILKAESLGVGLDQMRPEDWQAVSPLFGEERAGTAFPVDRMALAGELGFDGVSPNSLDAESDRDFAVEFLFAGALLGVHLSRLAEQLILYSTAEFGFVELDEAFTTGSSLAPTVRRYLDAYKERSGVDTTLVMTGKERRLESHLEVLIFRAVQELLANVREHAQATQVKVAVDMDTHQVRVSVEDNGKGFDAEGASFASGQGRGLKTLRERLKMVGGTVEVNSAAGKGSRIGVAIPTGE